MSERSTLRCSPDQRSGCAPRVEVGEGPLVCEHDETCITCGDTALPLTVLQVDEARELALCADDQGQRETVEIALVGPVEPGDSLLVHAGTAIARAA